MVYTKRIRVKKPIYDFCKAIGEVDDISSFARFSHLNRQDLISKRLIAATQFENDIKIRISVQPVSDFSDNKFHIELFKGESNTSVAIFLFEHFNEVFTAEYNGDIYKIRFVPMEWPF